MTVTHDEAIANIFETFGDEALTEYLASRPDRCPGCGRHAPTQGHTQAVTLCRCGSPLVRWTLDHPRTVWCSAGHYTVVDPDEWREDEDGRRRPVYGKVPQFETVAGCALCPRCGDSMDAPPLTMACAKSHWSHQQRSCSYCSGPIDYGAKRFVVNEGGGKRVNPQSLTVAKVVPPVAARKLGWSLVQINALQNHEPRCAACGSKRKARQ